MNSFSDYFAVLSAGILSNALLYEPTHREGFPEMARYSVGVFIVMMLVGALTGLWRFVEIVLKVFGVFALGLVIMRIARGMFLGVDHNG